MRFWRCTPSGEPYKRFWLSSLDDKKGYCAETFLKDTSKLEHGKIYSIEQLKEWGMKAPDCPKKLRAEKLA